MTKDAGVVDSPAALMGASLEVGSTSQPPQTCSKHSLVLLLLSFLFVWYLYHLHSCQQSVMITLHVTTKIMNRVLYKWEFGGETRGNCVLLVLL